MWSISSLNNYDLPKYLEPFGEGLKPDRLKESLEILVACAECQRRTKVYMNF